MFEEKKQIEKDAYIKENGCKRPFTDQFHMWHRYTSFSALWLLWKSLNTGSSSLLFWTNDWIYL